MPKKRIKKTIKTLLKLAVTVVALWLVFKQINWQEMKQYWQEANLLYIFTALILLNIGQVLSALRMRFYFIRSNLEIAKIPAIGIYYIGMLFNIILPGGIGGDGYKAWLIHKQYDFSFKRAILRVLSGRASGLLGLVVLTLILCFFSPIILKLPYALPITIAGLILVFPCYSLLAKYLLREDVKTQSIAFIYSIIVQFIVLITAFMLLKGLNHQGEMIDYLLLFMISSLVTVLPISIGGVGLRELTFLYGAKFFALNVELGIAISLLYFVVNTIASLLGLFAYYRMEK